MTRSRLVVLGLIVVAGSAAVYTATIASLSTLKPNEQPLTRFAEQVFQPEGDAQETRRPVVLTQVPPKYTDAGLREGIEGVVELEIVVSELGHVTSATVKKSLDATYGLDDAAIDAVKQWYFVPRTVGGKAVSSVAVVQMEFKLH